MLTRLEHWTRDVRAYVERETQTQGGRKALRAYGLALAVTAASLGVVWALAPAPTLEVIFVVFVPAILASAAWGGLGPALVSGGVALWVMLMHLEPRQWTHPQELTHFLLFVAVGAAIALGGEQWRKARARNEDALELLRAREAHLQSIFDAAPDAMIVLDDKGVIRSYSKAAERMFGWTPFEAIGRNIKILMPEPFRGNHDAYIGRYLATGERRIIGIGRIVVGERKDGSTFPMELAVGEVKSEEYGRYFTGFARDLTERQQTEARLQELQSELIHISRMSAMGEMASALAHELNQPLSAIANYLSGARRLLERGENADPRAVDALERANEQALRAGEIIRGLRTFLSRGEVERNVESLAKVVQEACALALIGVRETGVVARYDFDPKADRICVDRVQIQQVVVNLVRNAIDAMEKSARKEITVSTKGAEDGFVLVRVADTGPGLDPSVAARLFQPFVTTKAEGMGVGLSLCRTIVEAHGGRIWTEANPGGGAVFAFTLRRAEESEMAQAAIDLETQA